MQSYSAKRLCKQESIGISSQLLIRHNKVLSFRHTGAGRYPALTWIFLLDAGLCRGDEFKYISAESIVTFLVAWQHIGAMAKNTLPNIGAGAYSSRTGSPLNYTYAELLQALEAASRRIKCPEKRLYSNTLKILCNRLLASTKDPIVDNNKTSFDHPRIQML